MRLPKQVPKPLNWFTSSYTDNGGNCVEVALDDVVPDEVVHVRDTKARKAGHIAVPGKSWAALLDQLSR